jgi:hypothetical protein
MHAWEISFLLQPRDLIVDQLETAVCGDWLDSVAYFLRASKYMPGVTISSLCFSFSEADKEWSDPFGSLLLRCIEERYGLVHVRRPPTQAPNPTDNIHKTAKPMKECAGVLYNIPVAA